MPRRYHGWSHRYRSADNPSIDPKDRYRAQTLKNGIKGKVDPDPNGGPLTISNARKMAKLITDTGKLLPRMEAIQAVYPNNPQVIQPFVDRILELLPNSKYAAAWRIGIEDGKLEANDDMELMSEEQMIRMLSSVGLAPPEFSARGNHCETIVYEAGVRKGRMDEEARLAVLRSAGQQQ